MGEYIIGGLIVAYLLTIFEIDALFVDMMQDVFSIKATTNTYYFAAIVLSLVAWIFDNKGGK